MSENKNAGILSALKSVPKEKVFLGILLVLAIGFVLYQSLIIFQVKKLKAIDFQFLSQKKLLNFYEQITQNSENLKKELSDAESDFWLEKERFIEEADLPNYFTHFRELAKSHGLKVLALDFKPQEAIADAAGKILTHYQKLSFNVSLKGDYFDVTQLLYELEYISPKIFDIQSLRIKLEGFNSRQVFTDIDVTVYILMREEKNGKT